ncbi:MAG: hypothetical protein ACLPSH_04290 [Vulcanimicrobiaceae bacterium]
MVARKWTRLAEAVIAELGGISEAGSLSQAPDDVLLRASERCGLLLGPQFHRPEDRLYAIRRRLAEVESPESGVGEVDDDAIAARLRAIAFRGDVANMGPTDRRTTAEALRSLAMLKRDSRRRADREKRGAGEVVHERPAELDRERPMIVRAIAPAAVTTGSPVAERSAPRPEEVSRMRMLRQAAEDNARLELQTQRRLAEAEYYARIGEAMRRLGVDDGASRRLGLPGLGGL